MKLKYPCLVLDHDDTTVNSTATVHYPCFVEYMAKFFPDVHMSLEEYFIYNFDPGVVDLFTKICGMTWEQMLDEEQYWKEYVKHHVPEAYPGIREILLEQKRRGGKVCVVS
ncbi:MAG: HAD family hydrolase, partial [Clostridia bacterium]|nr:HAD family hydrolase [Clostridia bacterium]